MEEKVLTKISLDKLTRMSSIPSNIHKKGESIIQDYDIA